MHAVFAAVNFAPRLLKHGDDRSYMFGAGIQNMHVAAGHCRGSHIGRGDYSIRNDRVLGRMKLFHAADGYLAAARTRYMRSAGAEKIRKIGYLRLARSIEYNRFAIGGRRGDKYIFGRAHAREREGYFFSAETIGASAREHAALGLNLCAHKAQGCLLYTSDAADD